MIFNFDHSIHYLIPDLSDYNMTARTECVTPAGVITDSPVSKRKD